MDEVTKTILSMEYTEKESTQSPNYTLNYYWVIRDGHTNKSTPH